MSASRGHLHSLVHGPLLKAETADQVLFMFLSQIPLISLSALSSAFFSSAFFLYLRGFVWLNWVHSSQSNLTILRLSVTLITSAKSLQSTTQIKYSIEYSEEKNLGRTSLEFHLPKGKKVCFTCIKLVSKTV